MKTHVLIDAVANPYGISLECEVCGKLFYSKEHAASDECDGEE